MNFYRDNMSDNEEYVNNDEQGVAARSKWPAFVESTVVDFFMGYKLDN